ncbi:MAG: cysteine--tRNA ligase [Patescibacteria group bacterium]|nr:cysteine--tRNA ligase [Patescibacteria group bacterium]
MFSLFKKKNPHSLPALQLHNTLSGKTEVFEPINGVVKMYNCGPTPYDEQHIGNLFGQVVFNVLRRSLEAWNYKVKQVTNITDFGHLQSDADEGDDKMTLGLKREGLAMSMENMRKLAEKYTDIFLHDIEDLGVNTKRVIYPRASDYVGDMIALIKTLEEKSYAYKARDGVYFDTAKFPGYGKLGGISGGTTEARIAANAEKKNPADFALWKFNDSLGWDSPWGKGFPGWHIECTAMIFALLGKQIDIHTGGIEHIPVHHNNELAQAEAASGKKPFVRYWLHNAHITIEGKKISKSLGNTVYLHNIVDRGLNPRSLRYWFLTGHYRTPMNFTWDALEGANTALSRLTRAYLELGEKSVSLHSSSPSGRRPFQETDSFASGSDFLSDFYAAIANDLDTPKALARVWELVKDDSISPAAKKASLVEADKILGLGFSESAASRHIAVVEQSSLPEEIQALVNQREDARQKKDFAKADELRSAIEKAGFEAIDTPEGPTIIKK